MARRNLRKWAEAKQRRAEQYAPPRGYWSYSGGAPIFIEDPPFGTYLAPATWLPMDPEPLFPAGVGEVLHGIFHPEPQSGPPYTHTIPAPPGWEYDDEGEPIRPLFWPNMTVETHTPAVYTATGQARPDSTDLHPLLLDHDVDRCLR